jgi:hypothetical protein
VDTRRTGPLSRKPRKSKKRALTPGTDLRPAAQIAAAVAVTIINLPKGRYFRLTALYVQANTNPAMNPMIPSPITP